MFKSCYLYIIPVICSIAVLINVCNKNWFNANWAYVEVSFIALILSLCNSIPFFYRVYKKKTTISFSIWTLIINAISGLISLIKYPASFYYEATGAKKASLTIELLRWIPDIFANVISFLTVIFVLIYKFKNIKKNPEHENIKLNIKNKKLSLILVTMSVLLAISSLVITLYFKIINASSTKTEHWLYFLISFGACLSSISAVPFIIRLIASRNTYSISLYSKISLLLAMFVWTVIDIQTANRITVYLPMLISDFFIVLWTLIPVSYKVWNIVKAKKLKITEKEYCESL